MTNDDDALVMMPELSDLVHPLVPEVPVPKLSRVLLQL